MSLYKVRERLSKSIKNIQEPNTATIYSEDNSLYLITNGIFFSVTILYKGNVYLEDKLNYLFTIDYKSNKLTIVNLFKTKAPEILFNYEGDFEILSCEILTYQGNYIKGNFKNNAKQILIDRQKTNLEDETLIIREEVVTKKIQRVGKKKVDIKALLSKTNIANILSANSIEKLDKDQLSTIVPKFAEDRARITTTIGKQRVTTPVKKVIKKTPTKGGKY